MLLRWRRRVTTHVDMGLTQDFHRYQMVSVATVHYMQYRATALHNHTNREHATKILRYRISGRYPITLESKLIGGAILST